MNTTPTLLVHPGTHGVAVYARALAAAVSARTSQVRIVEPGGAGIGDAGTPVHAHFTDRLWGGSPEEASRTFAALASRHPLTVTLHDVPQASDGEPNRTRRRAAYALVASAARGVVVNSGHERLLLREEDVWSGPVASIPLPVRLDEDLRPVERDGSVGVLGFFYPGKGHVEAAHAAAAAGVPSLTVLGRASDGHAGDLEAFVRAASAIGVRVEVTGWLSEDDLARRARAVAVPVIAHRHISASGSLASWIGWGRKPLAVRNRYIDEMAGLRPGTVRPVDQGDLPVAVRRAANGDESTWHGLAQLPMSEAEVADEYVQWWEGVPW